MRMRWACAQRTLAASPGPRREHARVQLWRGYLRGLVSCCQQLTRKEYADGDRAEKGGGVVTIVP